MKRMTLCLVLCVLPLLAGAPQATGAPITGTVDIFLDGYLPSTHIHDSGLFGNIPSEGAITEVATAMLEIPAANIPWQQVYPVAVPLPQYQDGTTASIDEVFFTIVLDASSVRFQDGQTFELTYAGGTDIEIYRTLNYGSPILSGILKFVVKVWAIRTVPISLETERPATGALELSQNRPNPFRPPTAIAFELPRPDHVRLEVFDVSGKRVAVVLDRSLDAGSHTVHWDGRDDAGAQMQPGQYYYRFATNDGVQTRKMILLK